MEAEKVPEILKRRRSISKSNSSSSGDEENVGGIQRCRSVESLFEGELAGNMNYSDEEVSPPRMMMGAMGGGGGIPMQAQAPMLHKVLP